MRYPVQVGAALIGLLGATAVTAPAQVFPPGPGVAVGRSVGVSQSGRRVSYSVSFSSYGLGFYSPYPLFPQPTTGLTVVISRPQVVVPPPVIVIPPPEPEERGPVMVFPRPRAPREAPPERPAAPREPPPAAKPPPPEPPLPGDPASVFRPVRPEDRREAEKPVPPMPEPPLPAQTPAPGPARAAKPPPDAQAEPNAASAREVALGNEAFAAEEYGRAARHFRRAAELTPDDSQPFFLLAQAQFATGKYREAVASIHAGMRLREDWPKSGFRPADLYGPNVGDHAEHLRRLEEALARHPDDPVLLFLYAYELWFDGRQDEARPLFQKAAPLVADPWFIERFLKALPAARVAAR
jgi:hypothetical protein